MTAVLILAKFTRTLLWAEPVIVLELVVVLTADEAAALYTAFEGTVPLSCAESETSSTM